jgi:hypothetical protein
MEARMAMYGWVRNLGGIEATKDIAVGEEITISYLELSCKQE